jgi:hypothetical protein
VEVKHDMSGKEKEFLEEWKGKDIDGITPIYSGY